MADLWVRSQDGDILTKIKTLNIAVDEGKFSIFEDKYSFPLAYYKTEKRAKEILDEIQKLLMQPTAFLKVDIPQGMTLEVVNEYIKQINEFCKQNNLLFVGSKDYEIIPTNNTSIIYQMPNE